MPALVAVDVVVLALGERNLLARLVEIRDGPFAGHWAFPGSLVGDDESLEEVARRELDLERPENVYLEQLRTFGDPNRDPGARVVSTAYLALVPSVDAVRVSQRYADTQWADVGALPPLAYDHSLVAGEAVERLRAKLGYTNIVRALLAPDFTLSELQIAYEVILGRQLDRRNFQKKLRATNLLEAVGRKRGGAHRPAELYRFRNVELVTVDIL